MSLKSFANKFQWYRYMAYRVQKYRTEINPMWEINRQYQHAFHKLPNIENPKNLIEKIYWMQLHCDTSLWTLCADKYRMREYVKQCGCQEYLPELYGVWDEPDNINWETLPQKFVIKANNGCGTVLVIKDKSKYEFKDIKKTLRQWLAIPYGYRGYQPHYLGIEPCIIAEELLEQDEIQKIVSPRSIIDYKVWCFSGKVESILVTYNRMGHELSIALYDTNWNAMENRLRNDGKIQYHQEINIPKPVCLDEMLSVAERLSLYHPQIRVDFYIVKNRPVLGELTMSTGYGYFTEEYYDYLGALTDISLLKKIR